MVGAVALATLVSSPVTAKELPLWEIGGGGTALALPDYRGSDEYHGYVLPFPYLVYRGETFKVDRQRARAMLFNSRDVELDLSVNASVPVRSSRNEARRGMQNLDPVWELGPSLKWTLYRSANRSSDLSFRLPVRAAVASNFSRVNGAGFTATPTIGMDWRDVRVGTSPDWNFSALASVLYATRAYHDYIYSVAPQYATTTRAAYTAPGGYGGWQMTGTFAKRFGRMWAGGFVRYDNVANAAFDGSPLIRTRANASAGIALSWVFYESPTKVEALE